MNGNPLRWGILVGIIVCVVAVLGSLQTTPDAAYSAPEAQATSTSTPGPATCSLGGVALYCPHASGGNNLLGVSLEGGSGSVAVAVPTLQAVQGRIGATTPVAGVNPVLVGVQDYSNNLQVPHVSVPATGDNSGDARLQTSAFVQGQSTAGNTMVNILANPTTGALNVDARGNQIAAAATIVLPAQTPVAYAVSDAMAAATPAALTFSNMCRQNGGSGTLTKVRQMTDQTTNTARVRVHLYNSAPTPVTDNAPFTLLFSTAANYIGYVDLPPNTSEGAGSTAAMALNTDVRLSYVCSSSDTNLYAIPVTEDAFTPSSAQNWFWSAMAARD